MQRKTEVQQRFLESCRIASEKQSAGGIGTLGEKGVHAALKYYYEPFPENHEIRVGRFIADIVGEHGVIEIQTRSFFRLREKLRDFLAVCPVTIVYPVVTDRFLVRVDPDTGAIVSRRKSNKKGKAVDIFFELYALRSFLSDPKLQFRLPHLQVEDYRLQGSRKKGALIPTVFSQELVIECQEDWLALLPDELPDPFTTRDLMRLGHVSRDTAGRALRLLHELGLLSRGKERGHGNEYFYRKTSADSPLSFSGSD